MSELSTLFINIMFLNIVDVVHQLWSELEMRVPCIAKFVPDVEELLMIVLQLWEPLAERVGNVLKDYPTLSLTHGRKVGTVVSAALVYCSFLIQHLYPVDR